MCEKSRLAITLIAAEESHLESENVSRSSRYFVNSAIQELLTRSISFHGDPLGNLY